MAASKNAAAMHAQAFVGKDYNLSGLVLFVGPIVQLRASVPIKKAMQPFVALWYCPVCHHRPSSRRQYCCFGLLQQLNSQIDDTQAGMLSSSVDLRDLAIFQHWRDAPCRSGTSVVVSEGSIAPVLTRIF